MPSDLARFWTLDPAVAFLNHGSFGACPRPVLEAQQRLRERLERQPVRFFVRDLEPLLDDAAAAARAEVVVVPVPFPLASADAVVEAVLARVTPRTRLALLDHVTSPTGLVLPIERLVRELAGRGVDTLVDGAHAPGMVALDLGALGAAYYAGNCHKWLCAPKGAGFLHVRPEHQERIDGAIVSWGYAEPADFISRTELQGTRDAAAYLTVPEAIAFQRERGWDEVRTRCRALTLEARTQLCALLDTEPIAPEEMLLQMAAGRLPQPDPDLRRQLFDEHRLEI